MTFKSNSYKTQPKLSTSEMSNLGPGCYAKIKDGGKSYWTEIIKIEGNRVTAIVHPELSEQGKCTSCYSEGTAIAYGRDHIVGMGCDNYCWC